MAKLNLTAAQRQRYSDERLSLQELKSPQPGSWWQVVCNVRQEHAGPGGPFGLTPPPSPSPPRRIIDIQEDHGRDGGHVTSATILVLDRRAPNGSPFAVPFSQTGWNAFSKN